MYLAIVLSFIVYQENYHFNITCCSSQARCWFLWFFLRSSFNKSSPENLQIPEYNIFQHLRKPFILEFTFVHWKFPNVGHHLQSEPAERSCRRRGRSNHTRACFLYAEIWHGRSWFQHPVSCVPVMKRSKFKYMYEYRSRNLPKDTVIWLQGRK